MSKHIHTTHLEGALADDMLTSTLSFLLRKVGQNVQSSAYALNSAFVY